MSTFQHSGSSPAKYLVQSGDTPFHICFVCTGNICRSPMAEVIARDAFDSAGFGSSVRTSSCGLGSWHVGQKADERALVQLRQDGFDGSYHRAAQLGPEHMDADVFIAMDTGHRKRLIDAGISPDRIHLMRSFDPTCPNGADVDDPYYGSQSDFQRTLHDIKAAIPGLVEWVRETIKR